MSGFAAAAVTRAAQVVLMGFDVDGVLTDGTLYFGSSGEELKAFSSLDGHGLKMLQQAGIEVTIISGRSSPALELRAKNLGIDELHMGIEDKRAVMTRLAARRGIALSQAGYMGDDVVDLPVLRACGFSAAVADAHGEVLSRVDYVAARGGGRGAVREVCDLILRAQGEVGCSHGGVSGMKERASSLFPLAMLVLLAALTFWLNRVIQDDKPRGPQRHDPDYWVERFEVRRFDIDGKLQHTLVAEKLLHYPDDDTSIITAPKITYHQDAPAEVSARMAYIGSDGKQIDLVDNVRVVRHKAAGDAAPYRARNPDTEGLPGRRNGTYSRPGRHFSRHERHARQRP